MPTIEEIRAKMAQLQGQQDSSKIQLWKANPGNYVIRCLPVPKGKQGEGTPFIERWFYYINGMPSLLQPRQFNLPDPIHELQQKLWEGDADDRVLAKKLFAKPRTFVPMFVREGAGANTEKVLLWSFGKELHKRLLGFFIDPEIGDILDLENGFDIKVVITKQENKQVDGKTFNDITIDVARRSSPVLPDPDDVQTLLDSIPDIDDVYPLKSYDEIDSLLKKWLKGPPPDKGDKSNGTTRGGKTEKGGSGKDDLSALADEVAGKKSSKKEERPKSSEAKSDDAGARATQKKPEKAEKPAEKQPPKQEAKAKAKPEPEEVDDGDSEVSSLDEAFDSLMDE